MLLLLMSVSIRGTPPNSVSVATSRRNIDRIVILSGHSVIGFVKSRWRATNNESVRIVLEDGNKAFGSELYYLKVSEFAKISEETCKSILSFLAFID